MKCEFAGPSPCRGCVRPYLSSGRYMKPRVCHLCVGHAEEVSRTVISDDLAFNGGNFYRIANAETWFLTLKPVPFQGQRPEAIQ